WMKDYQKKFSNYFYSEEKSEKAKGMSSVELLNFSFDLLQDKLSDLVIEKHPVDIIVEISREQAGTLEFHRAEELIQVGRMKMEEAIKKFESGS
ncbi:MAG: phospholipase, partial [Cyclobacteriaceae bacterium]|nr:phospholipase [Cyclobacteriaceae bacterium]